MEREDFEAAIELDPDDDTSYLAYGDWLLTRGDPLGELIALQRRGLRDAADDLLGRHASYFLGPLANRPELLKLEWHLGFIRSCQFSLDDDRGEGHEQRAVDALDALLSLPSARFLRDLSLGVMQVPRNRYERALDIVEQHELRWLRRLAIGDRAEGPHGMRPLESAIGRPLPYASIPNVEALDLVSMDDDPDIEAFTH